MKKFGCCVVGVLLSACAVEPSLDEVPEASSELATATSAYVGCLIDTPAYDYYSTPYCYQGGTAPSTAVFQLFTSETPSFVKWSITDRWGNPRQVSCTGTSCVVPISPRQRLHGNVLYYVVNGTPVQGSYAIADYEYSPD